MDGLTSRKPCLGWMAQLVGMSPYTPKDGISIPGQGHAQVADLIPIRGVFRKQQSNVCYSH